ncbi:MAG: CRISPR system precrRNA processing endoribonuclease RAMP protein Cas6 [Chloroflexi bacterium]|nr:CRISPR system precrRNA processing endoribonuclease RAMP protein Cas6 [Chloroflexota bacterium]
MLDNLRFSTYRFTLTALDSLELPPYKGNVLRSGFGMAFKRLVCLQKDRQQPAPIPSQIGKVSGPCPTCLVKNNCPYAYIFETPRPQDAAVLRSYSEVPHPFVLEPPLDTRSVYQAGETMDFGLVLVGRAINYLPYFIVVFSELGKLGLGRSRGRFALAAVHAVQPFSTQAALVYNGASGTVRDHDLSVGIADCGFRNSNFEIRNSQSEITLRFLTPARLVSGGHLVDQPTFQQLVRGLLRRLSALCYFHCGERLEVDFPGLIAAAGQVRTVAMSLQWVDWERYSARQETRMKLGGFVGRVQYAGEVEPFLPFLRLGEVVHLGKACTFGNGKFTVEGRRA